MRSGLEENYLALVIAILCKKTPEQSFYILEFGLKKLRRITKSEADEMIKYKKRGMTYKAIGEMFGITDQAAHKRIKRRKENVN